MLLVSKLLLVFDMFDVFVVFVVFICVGNVSFDILVASGGKLIFCNSALLNGSSNAKLSILIKLLVFCICGAGVSIFKIPYD